MTSSKDADLVSRDIRRSGMIELMMTAKDLAKEYIHESSVMQIATMSSRGPWICTVYYVEDSRLNLYWLSLPTRRHSQEIKREPHVAIAIAVKPDKPVIGIQAEGTVKVVTDKKIIAEVMKQYTEKYGAGRDFYDNFIAGKNQHLLYKFTPQTTVLFDEVNFKNNTRVEIRLGD